MRTVMIAFVMSLMCFASAHGEAPDLSRACPLGYSVVNGKCTPPCEQGMRHSLSGRCTPIRCSIGQELVGNACKEKCISNKKRDPETGKCVAKEAGQ